MRDSGFIITDTNSIADIKRRRIIQSIGAGLFGLSPFASASNSTIELSGNVKLHILSDGFLNLPSDTLFQDEQQEKEATPLLQQAGLTGTEFNPPLNVTLLETETHKVLFDVGSGSQFLDSAGLLPSALEEAGVDPLSITDVVFTHAHPDHCWGLLDDFDELLCPDATYHMHGTEYDYWLSDDTLNNTDEAGLGFVAGARNRLPLIEEQLSRFEWGDEILPGIEAIDTHGHTIGHTSFVVHGGSEPIMVLGDALIHPVLSFQKPEWVWRSDQDPKAAVATRKRLLDRLATDRMKLIGYHLPEPGYGQVEKHAEGFRYVSS